MLILVRTVLATLCVAFLACAAARAQPASSEDGAFDVGPLRAVFSATQGTEGSERYHRQIPGFGPTRLSVEIVGNAGAAPEAAPRVDVGAIEIEAQLYWGKNELKPPELLETRQSRDGVVSFEHAFNEDGKYILQVVAREPGGAEHRGQYIFFVIQTADPQLLVASVASAFILGAVYFVWRQRRKPATPLAPRR